MTASLYFVGIMPVGRVQDEVYSVKQAIYQKYGTKGALRSPGHITLFMPFKAKDGKLQQVKSSLKDLACGLPSFNIQLNGFQSFEPRVVYIGVDSNPFLEALHQQVERSMKELHFDTGTYKNRGFTPHVTVAFRDLKKPVFKEVWDEYRDQPFKETFEAEAITLFEHTGKEWKVAESFPFQSD